MKRGSTGLLQLFGQMVMLPLSVFVYGMELFVRTIQGVQRAADEGMNVMVGAGHSQGEAADVTQTHGAVLGDQMVGITAQIPGDAPGNDGGLESSLAISTTDGFIRDDAEKNLKETIKMNDTDLCDDMLKLVRYKILFVKRDYEVAFPEKEELVHDNMTADAFSAWKVAEFIQGLGNRETKIPDGWKDYPMNEPAPKAPYQAGGWVLGFPERDKKYLRVYFEVLARYEREEARHAEDQIAVLKDIRNRL